EVMGCWLLIWLRFVILIPHGSRTTVANFGRAWRQRMCFEPQCPCTDNRVDAGPMPPSCFIAAVMNLTMMSPTEWNSELIADLATERPRLRKAQVVSIRRMPPADQARLLGN